MTTSTQPPISVKIAKHEDGQPFLKSIEFANPAIARAYGQTLRLAIVADPIAKELSVMPYLTFARESALLHNNGAVLLSTCMANGMVPEHQLLLSNLNVDVSSAVVECPSFDEVEPWLRDHFSHEFASMELQVQNSLAVDEAAAAPAEATEAPTAETVVVEPQPEPQPATEVFGSSYNDEDEDDEDDAYYDDYDDEDEDDDY